MYEIDREGKKSRKSTGELTESVTKCFTGRRGRAARKTFGSAGIQDVRAPFYLPTGPDSSRSLVTEFFFQPTKRNTVPLRVANTVRGRRRTGPRTTDATVYYGAGTANVRKRRITGLGPERTENDWPVLTGKKRTAARRVGPTRRCCYGCRATDRPACGGDTHTRARARSYVQ